jgi:phage regulator Rha-like protein
MQIANISNVQTMTTREIAELIEKQHSHIKVSAERLAEKGIIGTLALREFTHNGNVYTEYLLNKRDSLILVAQNCPEFTTIVVQDFNMKAARAAIAKAEGGAA